MGSRSVAKKERGREEGPEATSHSITEDYRNTYK
jgi:hypothetical protein